MVTEGKGSRDARKFSLSIYDSNEYVFKWQCIDAVMEQVHAFFLMLDIVWW